MRRKEKYSAMWDYLEKAGVLEKGTDAEIKAAKKAYRKTYFLKYKQAQRKKKPELTINFKKENGDYDTISIAAKRHKMTLTAFVRQAALAYLKRTYVVPNSGQIARLEQLLSECLNEIKTIVTFKEKYFWQRKDKLDQIEKRIQQLETQISEVFRNPPLAIQNDHQNQIA